MTIGKWTNLGGSIVAKQYGPNEKPNKNMAVEGADMEGSQKNIQIKQCE